MEMNRTGLRQAYDKLMTQEYKNNPELAEELMKYIKALKSLAFRPSMIASDWVKNTGLALELTQVGDYHILIHVMTFKTNKLRAEYDEEWVEMGFLSVEDGGRGVEF